MLPGWVCWGVVWLRISAAPSIEERAGVVGMEKWLGGAGVAGAEASCSPGMLRAGEGGGRPAGAAWHTLALSADWLSSMPNGFVNKVRASECGLC